MDSAVGVRRLILVTLLLAAALVAGCGSGSPVQAAWEMERRADAAEGADEPIVFWHIPHPDDETIGMAGGIIAAAEQGERNIVVIYTEGEASDVRLVLNGVVYCTLHGRFHRPHAEGYEPLDKAAFGRARMLETTTALGALGVNAEDILSIGLPDGGVSVDAAYDVIQALDIAYPGAAHRTTALTDGHEDHRNLARALNTLVQQKRQLGEEPDVQFYSVYVYRSAEERRAATLSPVPVADPERKRHALDEFSVWAPEAGRFAIGMHSVPRLIANASADPFEYVEGAPATLKALHLREPRTAFNVLSDQAALQWQVVPSVFVRLGIRYSGQPTAPTLFYEAPTHINAVKVRIGIAPSSGNAEKIGFELAGLRILEHLLVEYRPVIRSGGPSTSRPSGKIRIGVKFTL